jgi:hypothetical protein
MRTPESVIARKIFNDYLGRFEINNINGEKNNCTNESFLEQTRPGGGIDRSIYQCWSSKFMV